MTSFVKDPENAATSTAPGAPASPMAKSPNETPVRPQPVALEVPVIVNGARAVDGSDKREPFSERSQTVLVFGHGAVIRVSVALTPGQLIFLTNEKTRKEVVCQVVKSKTDGNAVGYVELRFTEPAPGFWGMRFPSDTVLPQAAPRPAGSPVAAPKAAPPAPVASSMPVAPFPPKPTAPPIAVKPAAPAPPVPSAPFEFTKPTAPPSRSAFEANAYGSPLEPEVPSVASLPVADAKPVLPSTPAPVSSSNPTTEELKQQAARLQEQLSSLLFSEAPKPANADALSSSASQASVNLSDVAAPRKTATSIPPAGKSTPPSSLTTEELQIPAWLAPLARETDPSSSVSVPPSHSAPSVVAASPVETEESVKLPEPATPEEGEISVFSEPVELTRRPETAVFGGQLLGESSQPVGGSGSKSGIGLFFGIAAGLLLIAGGFWYSQQPGNAISGLFGGSSPAEHSPSAAQESAATSPAESPKPATTPASAASSPAASVNPPVESAVAPTTVDSTPALTISRNSNFTSTPMMHSSPAAPAPRANAASVVPKNNTPEVVEEEPKKPALGDVRMAAPKIRRGKAAAAPGEPSIDINQVASPPAPVSALESSHKVGPAAPAPVGGDVKPAKLLKSVPPVYPDMARNQRISGNVQIDALIGTDGNVSTMKVLSGPPLLHQAAMNAVKQWKFQPAELNGNPTTMHLTVTVQFRTQ